MTPSQITDWVYQTTAENYLWSGSIPSKESLNSSLGPIAYFEQLRYSNTSFGGYSPYEYGDRFSRIQERSAVARSRSLNAQSEVDFGFKLRYILEYNRYKEAQVIYTYKGSPAHKNGLRRGEIIRGINGRSMSSMTQSEVLSAIQANQVTISIISPQRREITLQKESYPLNPIIMDTIYSDRVAYLHYTGFIAGSGNSNNISLMGFFSRARARNVEDLILDFRYNGGGDLSVAQFLGSLIARREMLGDVMIYKESNKNIGQPSKFEPMLFLNTPEIINANLNPRKIVILTSSATASASELIIQALRPYFRDDLKVVGQVTVGKNLGGIEYSSNRHNWEFYLMTFRVYNREKVSDYEKGIKPDSEKREFTSTQYDIAAMGDRRNDPLLIQAIEMLGKTTMGVSTLQSSRSISAPQEYLDIPSAPLIEKRVQIDY